MQLTQKELTERASAFAIEGDILAVEPVGEGFINDTYHVRTAGSAPDYILQRKNSSVFPDVPAMMQNICKVSDHIRRKVEAAGGDPLRESLTVIPARDGQPYHLDEKGAYWAVTRYIDRAVVHDRADTLDLARKGGEGIGRFQSLLDDFREPLHETIRGFHDIRHRFAQWDAALARDAAGRCREVAGEIGWIEERRERMLGFKRLIETGEIPVRVTHNDTKLANILFDERGEVLCVIDLDTVMNSPSLYDFGDAIRSYANTGAEDDRDPGRVALSPAIFRAYTEGYLSQRAGELTEAELDRLAFSAEYITYEQVLRFLMDYIDGDIYYKTRYPEHNLVRTRAQYALLRSMEEQRDEMRTAVDELAARCGRRR